MNWWFFAVLLTTCGFDGGSSAELRSDVPCPDGWSYALDLKCMRFFSNDTMLRATVTCQKYTASIGAPVTTLETVVVHTLAVNEGLNINYIWFGRHTSYMTKVDNIMPCPNNDMSHECVRLSYRASGAPCWTTVDCADKLPFYCIGSAMLLRMHTASGQGHKSTGMTTKRRRRRRR